MGTFHVDIESMFQRAHEALERAWNYLHPFLSADCKGGVICMIVAVDDRSKTKRWLFHTILAEKANRYYFFAEEKAMRLQRHASHLSSRQSMNKAQEQYPGAVRCRSSEGAEVILSFSGLPAAADEALMLLIALELRWMDEGLALQIAALANDPDLYFERANELHRRFVRA